MVVRSIFCKMDNLFLAALLAALFSVGHCISCYKGITPLSQNLKGVSTVTCTKVEVCLRTDYLLDGKPFILRDCANDTAMDTKINSDREELKRMLKPGHLPNLTSLITCHKSFCNSASCLHWSWGFMFAAVTAAVLGATW